MKITDFITESSDGLLYHGDDFGTTKLDPKWMIHDISRNQEGVGIYFTPDKSHALQYGPKVSSIALDDLDRVVNSREIVSDHVSDRDGVNFLKYIHNHDDEIWYMFSDYVEVVEPEDVDEYIIEAVWNVMKNEELRNFQIEVSEASSTPKVMVEAWNHFIKIDALHEKQSDYYAVIKTDINVTPVNF